MTAPIVTEPGPFTRVLREVTARTEVARLYGDDPARFVLECIQWAEGEGPTSYQREVLEQLKACRRVTIRSPHSAGKTALASWIVLWFALTRNAAPSGDWKVVTTASVWRQLEVYLWPEIHKWARRLRWDMVGRGPFNERDELLERKLKLSGGQAFAVASDKPESLEGAHADRLLYVFDEAKAIPNGVFDAAEGALASGDCYAVAISTPGEPQGRFYEIHARRPGLGDWWVRHVTKDEVMRERSESGFEEWAASRLAQWGAESAVYQNRVLGEFASAEEDGIIPLAWVEAANERWLGLDDSGEWGDFAAVGVDVAGSGEDKTVLALRYGDAIRELRRFAKQDTMQTAGAVAGVLRAHGGEAVVDVIGIGAGVVHRLREQGKAVSPFNASERTDATDKSGELGFANKRSAAWWNLREMLDPASGEMIALPPDDLLTGDLTAPHWRENSSGKVQVESKDGIHKRLGRSTDDGDAVVMAFVQQPDEVKPDLRFL